MDQCLRSNSWASGLSSIDVFRYNDSFLNKADTILGYWMSGCVVWDTY